MEKIKSKKSKDIDFEDLFDDINIKPKKKKGKKHKKNKHKNKSSKSSINKKTKKKIKKNADNIADFFKLDDKQKKIIEDNAKKRKQTPSIAHRIADSINMDAKVNVDISDQTVANVVGIISGLLLKIFTKK